MVLLSCVELPNNQDDMPNSQLIQLPVPIPNEKTILVVSIHEILIERAIFRNHFFYSFDIEMECPKKMEKKPMKTMTTRLTRLFSTLSRLDEGGLSPKPQRMNWTRRSPSSKFYSICADIESPRISTNHSKMPPCTDGRHERALYSPSYCEAVPSILSSFVSMRHTEGGRRHLRNASLRSVPGNGGTRRRRSRRVTEIKKL